MDFRYIGKRWSTSVLQLSVIQSKYDLKRPYKDPSDEIVIGTGFIIDIEKGFILTNSKIVSNPISIIGRSPQTGKRDLSLELLSICREKDIALCKINHEDINLITRGYNEKQILSLNMEFGDSMDVEQGDQVIAIGYSNDNENIICTLSSISGFNCIKNINQEICDSEDAIDRNPSYIEITSILNSGNSGGPLLDKNGKVIGIIAGDGQNCIIPSRTFLSIYSSLLKSEIVKHPTLALDWNKTNREIMKLQTGTSYTYGIYVRGIYPDSAPDKLQKGDIIRRIDFEDPYWCSPDNYNIKQCGEGITEQKTTLISCFLDRFGISTKICKLKDPNEVDNPDIEKVYTDRNLNLNEIMDMVPIDTPLTLDICRNGNWYKLKTKYNYIETDRIKYVYPKLESIDYEIFAGICCVNLTRNHIDIFDNLQYITKDFKEKYTKYKKQVIIVQIFPNTNTFKTQVLKPGNIIDKVNNEKINCLDDIRHILRTKPKQISIETKNGSFFISNTNTIINEDKKLMENFNINNHNYLLE